MRSALIPIAVVMCTIHIVRAANPAEGLPDDARAKALAARLASDDQATVDAAVGEINTLYESDADESVGFYRKYWLPSLMSASQFELAEHLALQGILAVPWQTGTVEFLQETRVRIELRTGHPEQALSESKSLFNIAGLRGTERALLLIAQCLKAVHPGDAAILRRLGKEQLAGATTRPMNQAEPASPLLAGIPIDASPYAAAIGQLTSDDDHSRTGKGNLLLLAGRCDEAQTIFQSMKRLSDSGDRIGLAENVARALKSFDGTIGRANGYMLSEATAHYAE